MSISFLRGGLVAGRGKAMRGSLKRRWITLISAGWLPHCIGPSRGCLDLEPGIIPFGMPT